MGVAELEEYQKQFERIAEEAKLITAALSEAQFNWRPAPDAWSIEECLAHLILVGQQELKLIERAVDEARSRGLTGRGPFRYGWLQRTIVRQTEPPARRRFSAPRRFHPLHGQPVTAVLPTFLHVQSQFIGLVQRCDGLDLARIKVPTLISRFLRLSLGMILAQQAAHERRHMAQARAVRQHPEFPAAS
jgi:DinB superfamily